MTSHTWQIPKTFTAQGMTPDRAWTALTDNWCCQSWPEFGTQHPCGGSQLPVMPVSGNRVAASDLHRLLHTCYTYSGRYAHIKINSKWVFNNKGTWEKKLDWWHMSLISDLRNQGGRSLSMRPVCSADFQDSQGYSCSQRTQTAQCESPWCL